MTRMMDPITYEATKLKQLTRCCQADEKSAVELETGGISDPKPDAGLLAFNTDGGLTVLPNK